MLDDQVNLLFKEVRGLEGDKLNLLQQLSRVERGAAGPGEGSLSLSTVMRDRDQLATQLSMEEARRKAAVLHNGQLEEDYRSARRELEDLRRQVPELEAYRLQEEYKSRRSAEDLVGLRKLVDSSRQAEEQNIMRYPILLFR